MFRWSIFSFTTWMDMNALNMRREEATKTAKQKKHVQKQNRAQHGAVLCGLLLQQGRFSAPPAEWLRWGRFLFAGEVEICWEKWRKVKGLGNLEFRIFEIHPFFWEAIQIRGSCISTMRVCLESQNLQNPQHHLTLILCFWGFFIHSKHFGKISTF